MTFVWQTLLLCGIFTGLSQSTPFDPNRTGINYPGTKWCGPGHSANSVDDIGSNYRLDSCCRDHDLCPDKMRRGTSKHGLTNDKLYSLSRCDCDEKFYICLKDDGSTTANLLGNTFFTILRTKCYKKAHPATCVRKSYWRHRCLEYKYDTNKPKIWQFFEPNNY